MRATGARLHLCRPPAAGASLVRAAKAEGLPITADVSINSLMLTDRDIGYFNSAFRVTPPLRQPADRDALQAGLADGTLDALVSDHMPVTADEDIALAEATPGATAWSCCWAWPALGPGCGPLACLVARRRHRRAGACARAGPRFAGRSAGRLVVGGWPTSASSTPPRPGRSRPLLEEPEQAHALRFSISGVELPARVRCTLVAGQVAFEAA